MFKKRNSMFSVLAFTMLLAANPQKANAGDVCLAWSVTGIAFAWTVLWLIPFSVSVGKGSYAYEQFCTGNSGALCCDPPTINPTQAPVTTTVPNASTSAPTTAPAPRQCVFQTENHGSCGSGKTLYCPGQTWPAPVREENWVTPLTIASGVLMGIGGLTTAISFLIASTASCCPT